MDIRTDDDSFAKKTQGISKTYHKLLLLLKFLQTKPQVKNMNINFYDLYYTVIKTRKNEGTVEKQDIINVDESDYINENDFVTPNHYIGRKDNIEMLRHRNSYLTKKKFKVSDESIQIILTI